jgi:hypothetical protein
MDLDLAPGGGTWKAAGTMWRFSTLESLPTALTERMGARSQPVREAAHNGPLSAQERLGPQKVTGRGGSSGSSAWMRAEEDEKRGDSDA